MVNELQEVQWAYLLSPEFELINSAGKPLTGGWLEVYIHGTRTKYYCASDFTGTLHPFKIPLDSLGANIVLASHANAYDVYCYNKYGTLVMSRYNVLPQVAGTSIVSGGVVLDSSDGTITIEQTGDNVYDLSVADIIDSVTANIDESITNIEGDITEINQSITGINLNITEINQSITGINQDITEINQDITEINQDITNITNVVTGLPTHGDVYDAVVTGIDYTINTVTGLIPQAQVQSDWDETDPSDPAYILNKPDLDNYVTEQELIEVVSGISGLNLEYGQFYCQTTTGGAVMGRTKGNIEVTNDGKIKLKKGQSYHVTVRGGYSKTTASADYNVLSYIEYITGQNINVNVDNSVTDTQYFEISYDLYKLSSDKNYYVFFSLPTGSSVNNLFIEIHSIGCMGTGGSGSGVPVEYDAGWGINIIDNVISVDPSILNQYVTQEELASAVSGLAPEYTAGDNIVIDNDTISLSDVVTIQAREGETSSGSISFGNIVHWGQQDYGPGWTIEAYTDQGRGYHSYNTCDIGLQSFFWGDYDHDRDTNSVSGQSTITISEGDIKYQQGDFQSTDTLPVIWSCSQMAQDISELQEAITAVSGSFVQEQSDWAEQDSTKVDYIKNKPVEKQLIAGDNIVITESATGVVISAAGGASATVQNIVEYVDGTTTPNFFNDCVALLEQGLEPVAKYQDNIYQLWRVQTSGNTYTALGFICIAFHNFQNGGISYEHQHAYNWQLWTDANGVYPGADRMGYNYLGGEGIDAVTGVVNGEYAITYSINPMEVATAISGLIPTGSNYSAGDGIDITNNIISVDNTVAMKTDIPDVSDFVTEAEVSAMIPEQEDVEFLELVAGTNITLTETATGIVIDAAGGGSSYTAGSGIDITNDVISVDNTVALKTDIPEQEDVEFLELTAGDNISIASGVISVTGMPDITDLATKAELQDGLELVTGLIPTDYATDAELQDGLELVTGLIPNYTAGDNIDITNNVISVSGTEDLTLMNLTAGEGISITPDVSGNVEIACTSTGVTKTLLYTGSSTDTRSGTFTLSQSGYNFDRLEMTLIDVDNYVIKQVCEMPADNLVGVNGTRGSSFNSITSGTQTWFKAMNWQLNSAGTTLTYWVDEIATSGDTVTAINRNQTANRPIMLRIYGIKE